jgi:putative transposase
VGGPSSSSINAKHQAGGIRNENAETGKLGGVGDSAPRWLLRDRDSIYDDQVRRRIASLGITEVVSSPLSPWQNPYVERVIGSIRRECLDHVIILNHRHLRRILRAYLAYYHRSRTHLGLDKDAPDRRPASSGAGPIVVTPEVGGLHQRYDRQAA